MAAVLGGTNSLHTNALDEVLALPSAKSAQIALRTQQVIMEETGVINVADPLGGSWYVEALTDRLEAEAEHIFTRIRDLAKAAVPSGQHPIGEMTSGILRGIENGYFTGEIADAAFANIIAVEKGEKKVVGVNSRVGGIGEDLEILRISGDVETDQNALLARRRAARNDGEVSARLAALVAAARGTGNMVPAMLDAVRAEATLGEICDALRTEWGTYTEQARI
jgi:methylmalonyl-CoA mutase N-terminal domain/subunit